MSFLGRDRLQPDYDSSVLASYLGKRIRIKDHEFFTNSIARVVGWRSCHFRCFRAQLQDGSLHWILPQELELIP